MDGWLHDGTKTSATVLLGATDLGSNGPMGAMESQMANMSDPREFRVSYLQTSDILWYM